MLLENPDPQKIVPQHPYDNYKTGYINFIKRSGRRFLSLYNSNEDKGGVPYARYMYAVHIGERIPDWLEVDHVNNDPTDDRIENLQLLTKAENIAKYHQYYQENIQVKHDFNCPQCNKLFYLKDGDYKARSKAGISNFFCSRSCYDTYVQENKKTVTVKCDHCFSDVILSEYEYRHRESVGLKKVFCDETCHREFINQNHLVKLNCDICQKPFTLRKSIYEKRLENNVSDKLCCSLECTNKSKINPDLHEHFNCENCGKEYSLVRSVIKRLEGKNHTSRFCSRDCMDMFKRKGDFVKNLVCHTCHKPFTITTGEFNSRRNKGTKDFYCSKTCFSENRKTKDMVDLKCAFCFSDMQVKASQYRKKTDKGQKNFFCMGSDCYKKFRLFGGDKREVHCAQCQKQLEHRSEIKHAIVTENEEYLQMCSSTCLFEKLKDIKAVRMLNEV